MPGRLAKPPATEVPPVTTTAMAPEIPPERARTTRSRIRDHRPCLGLADMPFRLHAVVQYPDDLHEVRLQQTVEERVHRIGDRRLAAFVAAVAEVKAANAGDQLAAIDARRPLGIGGDTAQRGGEAGTVAEACFLAVKLRTPSQDRGDVGLRRLGEPIARHAGIRRRPKRRVRRGRPPGPRPRPR